MVPDARSSSGGNTFDFNSQAGVLAVLGAIRTSTLTSADRNELRDLVFLYSNGGGDPAVRTVLEERLRQANITPNATVAMSVASAKSEKVTSVSLSTSPTAVETVAGFSGGRPVPFFTPGAISSVPVPPAPEAAPSVMPNKETTTVPVRPVVVIPRPVVATSPVPVTPSPVSPLEKQPEASDVPVSSPIPQPVVVPAVETPSATASQRLDRIRQIKSDVNSRVGNPVNLVEIDNALGREYMSALLESMKLINDAPEAQSTRAMDRLEAVYAQVIALLDQPKAAPVATVSSVSSPVVPTITPIIPVVQSVPLAPPPPVPPPTPVPVSLPEPEVVVPGAVVSAVPPWGEAQSVAELSTDHGQQVATPVVPLTQPTTISMTSPVPVAPFGVQSVASSQAPLRSIGELPTADEVHSVSAGGDPLATKEVDAGLQQLLSEWSLFKKSGLFGTGPSGREHPLFLKIAPLPIPLVLTGRFEGSTQEIKQSVTDYMNGWRYEQGIVYEKDETFERYLRRVIRHIIDLQNKKRGA